MCFAVRGQGISPRGSDGGCACGGRLCLLDSIAVRPGRRCPCPLGNSLMVEQRTSDSASLGSNPSSPANRNPHLTSRACGLRRRPSTKNRSRPGRSGLHRSLQFFPLFVPIRAHIIMCEGSRDLTNGSALQFPDRALRQGDIIIHIVAVKNASHVAQRQAAARDRAGGRAPEA